MKPRKPLFYITRRYAGLTLVELLMAVSVMSVIGLGVTGMLTAVTRGTDVGQDLRQASIDHTRMAARLGAAIREAQLVLAADAQTLVLWQSDQDADAAPDLQELELIRWDPDTQRLIVSRLDDAVVKAGGFGVLADDLVGALGIDLSTQTFGSVPETLIDALAGDDADAVVWAEAISGFDIDTHRDLLSEANLVSYRIALSIGGHTETAIGTVWLRNFSE